MPLNRHSQITVLRILLKNCARPCAAAALAVVWCAGCLGPIARGPGAPRTESAVKAPVAPTPGVLHVSAPISDSAVKSESPGAASFHPVVKATAPAGPRFRLPLKEAKVRSAYGKRRGRFHAGIDLLASARGGEPILASADGVVVHTGQHGGYGRMVLLKHPDGWFTRYAHMRSIAVSVDETVTAGDTLGLVGSTGRATGPHLHFEILTPDKKTVDPAPYLFPAPLDCLQASQPPAKTGRVQMIPAPVIPAAVPLKR